MLTRTTRRTFVIAALATAGAMATGGAHADGEERQMIVKGELAYRERIALPRDAVAIVELKPSDAADGDSVTAEARMPLDGAQVPVAFELSVERSRLDPGKTYVLRGGILAEGAMRWLSDPVEIETDDDLVRIGVVTLKPFRAPAPFGMSDPALIVGHEWTLTSIAGRPVIEGTEVTITFGADGAFHGRACNSFRGGYEIDGNSLSLGNAAATMMACAEPIMAQEGALFEAFERVASWQLDGSDALLLADDSGTTLVSARR